MGDRAATFNIHLKSTADASGTQEIDRALGVVIKSEEELAAARAKFLTAAEAEVALGEKMVETARREAAARAESTANIRLYEAALAQTNTAGQTLAQNLSASFGIIQRSEQQVLAARSQFLTATQAEVAEVNRLTEAAQRETAAKAQSTTQTRLQAGEIDHLDKTIRELEEDLIKARNAFRNLTPQQAALPGARAQIEHLESALGKAGMRAGNLGTQMLYASRGIQDFQAAGLLGVVNNLEQIAVSLGLGAGVAGVITVLAVTVQQFGPGILRFFKSFDTEGARLDELTATLKRAATAIKGDYSANAENAKRISEAFTKALKDESEALDRQNRDIAHNSALLKERQKIQATDDERLLKQRIAAVEARQTPPTATGGRAEGSATEAAPGDDRKEREIAALKLKALADERAREDAAATDATVAQVQRLALTKQRQDELKQRQTALEVEKANAVEFNTLQADQLNLENKNRDAKYYAKQEREMFSKAGMAVPDNAPGKLDAQRAEKQLAESKARQKELLANSPEGALRKPDVINKDLESIKTKAEEAAVSVRSQAEQLQHDRELRALEKRERDQAYYAKQQEIVGPLEDKPRALVQHDHSTSDPFATRPKRNLYEEELNGTGPVRPAAGNRAPSRTQRDLVAEEEARRRGETVTAGTRPGTRDLAAEEKARNAAAPAPAPRGELTPAERERLRQLIEEWNAAVTRYQDAPGGDPARDKEKSNLERISAELDPLQARRGRSGVPPDGSQASATAPQNGGGSSAAAAQAAIDKVVASNNEMAAAMMGMADDFLKTATDTLKRVATVEKQVRNLRTGNA